MKQNLGKLEPMGLNVYQDSHKRMILADRKSKKLFVIEKEDERKVNLLLQRPVIAITALLLIGYLAHNWLLACICAVVIYAVCEYLYRYRLLPSLTEVTASLPEKEKRIDIFKKENPKKNYARAVGGFILPVLLFINDWITIKEKGFDGINTIALIVLSIAFAIYAVYISIVSLKAAKQQEGVK